MKKFLLFSLFLTALFFYNDAKAETYNYYAKVILDVAEDSKGLGTVYMEDNDDNKVMEKTDMGSDTPLPGSPSSGGNVGFRIFSEPAEGYAFANFTDQDGNVYTPSDNISSNYFMIVVYATSSNQDDPTVFNLSAHFVPESELSKDELAEVTVSPESKFNTYISPVATEIPADINAYTVTGIDKEAVVLQRISDSVIEPFTAVLLENTGLFETTVSSSYDKADLPEEMPSLTTGLLNGTFEEITAPEASYVLTPIQESGSVFQRVEDDMTFVEAYNCYLTAEKTDQPTYEINPYASVIKSLLDNDSKVEIFDIEGRRLNNLQKGINIVNGTKVIVK